jgi:hypothetical protein
MAGGCVIGQQVYRFPVTGPSSDYVFSLISTNAPGSTSLGVLPHILSKYWIRIRRWWGDSASRIWVCSSLYIPIPVRNQTLLIRVTMHLEIFSMLCQARITLPLLKIRDSFVYYSPLFLHLLKEASLPP